MVVMSSFCTREDGVWFTWASGCLKFSCICLEALSILLIRSPISDLISLILSILYLWSISNLGGLKFEEDNIELSFNGMGEVGDIGFVATFLSLDLLIGFFGRFSWLLPFLFFDLDLELLWFDDIDISRALSLILLNAPTNSAADLSEFEVA